MMGWFGMGRCAIGKFRMKSLGWVLLGLGVLGGATVPPALAPTHELHLGAILATARGGSLTLSPQGQRSVTGGALLGTGLNCAPGSFTVTGAPGAAWVVTVPATDVILTDRVSGQHLPVDLSRVAFADPLGRVVLASLTGTLPAGATPTTTTPDCYVGGITVKLDQATPKRRGVFRGFLPLQVRYGTDALKGALTLLNLPIQVDLDVPPIALAWISDLNFGTLLGPSSDVLSTVIISPTGVRKATGEAQVATGSSCSAASFTVSGQGDATYSVTLPDSCSLTLGTSGSPSMTVNQFTSATLDAQGKVTNPTLYKLDSNTGSQMLLVGATLTVGKLQAVGTYSGKFTVSVTYN